jgi:hypothetical protein
MRKVPLGILIMFGGADWSDRFNNATPLSFTALLE